MSNELLDALRSFEIFFDVEASGLSDDSYPIEVGIIGKGKQYSSLIKPYVDPMVDPAKENRSWTYWSSQSQAIHKITRKQLEKEGQPIDVVCNEINEIFKGETICSDSKFDPFWLDILFDKAGIEMQFKCINLTRYLDKTFIEKLAYELPTGDRVVHRALPDAEDLRDAWNRVCNWVEKHQTKSEVKA
jgi:DNA polymerase III epsilon subunit-like protein